jgi:hypothetical protein
VEITRNRFVQERREYTPVESDARAYRCPMENCLCFGFRWLELWNLREAVGFTRLMDD